MSEENLTPDELKYICEVNFNNKPLDMLKQMQKKYYQAKKENNLVLSNLLEKDIRTMKKTTHFDKVIIKIDGKEYKGNFVSVEKENEPTEWKR